MAIRIKYLTERSGTETRARDRAFPSQLSLTAKARMPFFHGDQIADGSVYSAAWDAFVDVQSFMGTTTVPDHLDRYRRRIEWIARNSRQSKKTRHNVLACFLFPRGEPTSPRDVDALRAKYVESHAKGLCARCRGATQSWLCPGCMA